MDNYLPTLVLHWNYRGFTEFPIQRLEGGEAEVTDIYLKENLISRIPNDIGKLVHLESLYLSGNDITELPREIANLRCMKCLDLSGNRLKSIPEEIGEVRSLKFLILDENELTELPLRLAELRDLRYLSVCDNKLGWLPQRPVYNFYHCEFRFWRNPMLKIIPYSLWYHMFRGQQTRSLNIGCLTIPRNQEAKFGTRCRIKLSPNSREWDIDLDLPSPHRTIFESHCCSPSSLYEMCRRSFYKTLANAASMLSTEPSSIYTNNCKGCKEFKNLTNLREQVMNIDHGNVDLNGNLENSVDNPRSYFISNKIREKSFFVPKDIIDEHFNFLPKFMKREFYNGPPAKCENIYCKTPVFDYASYEFCIGKIVLIDNLQDVILSATFCSKACANSWKGGKTLLPWKLLLLNERHS